MKPDQTRDLVHALGRGLYINGIQEIFPKNGIRWELTQASTP